MHLVLRLQGRQSDRRLVARMREEGLYAEALADWGMDGGSGKERKGGPAILLNFTNVETQAMAEKLGRRIARLL
jgi:GntR family transcriptional regulator/MocR family aminotransferase